MTRRSVGLFAGLFCLYASFSPTKIAGMGYTGEIIACAEQLATRLLGGSGPIDWPRHGFLEPLLQLPFILPAQLLFGRSAARAETLASFHPILMTALLCALLFAWAQRLTTARRAFAVTIGAAFATMLWPYAYIGLEPSQSFFLLLAAWCALVETRRGWGATLGFAVAAAIASAVKSNGIFLLPALGWLGICFFRDGRRFDAGKVARLGLVAGIVGGVFALGGWTRSFFWAKQGGGEAMFVSPRFLIEGPIDFLINLWGLLTSANKGLAIYAPLAALGLLGMRRAFRAEPRLAVFALLALGGTAGAISMLRVWAEETWGPRYLHCAIGPLALCLAAAIGRVRLDRPVRVVLAGAFAMGLTVSFLGASFYYGLLQAAATRANLCTLENLQFDPHLNHVKFNAALLAIWARGRLGQEDRAAPWPREPFWWFEAPADAPAAKTVDLREYAAPQPIWTRGWRSAGAFPKMRAAALLLLVLGLGGLWRAGRSLADEGDEARQIGGAKDGQPGRAG